MSLLIKALDKAEKAAQADKAKKTQSKRRPKALQTDSDNDSFPSMSLAEPNADLLQAQVNAAVQADSTPIFQDIPAQDATLPVSPAFAEALDAERAANVFAAKRIVPSHQNAKLAMLGGIALLALLGIGWYVYQAIQFVEPVIPPRPMMAKVQPAPEKHAGVLEAAIPAQTPEATVAEVDANQVGSEASVDGATPVKPTKKMEAEKEHLAAFEREEPPPVVPKKIVAKPGDEVVTPVIASRSVSVSVSKAKPDVALVNPTLMRAYEAYSAGNDSEAQALYKQVLQRDTRNVDALLGLGVIASRQGRDADAHGWYRKVLELEPKNSIAQAAIAATNQDTDQNSESRLRAMIEKFPDNADLQARLGHLYADQNQWAAAQQAYFEANRLNPNAENAFNLAVSLDQMGKPKLALPYYQKALETIGDNSSIDKSALEARIQAIQ